MLHEGERGQIIVANLYILTARGLLSFYDIYDLLVIMCNWLMPYNLKRFSKVPNPKNSRKLELKRWWSSSDYWISVGEFGRDRRNRISVTFLNFI